MAALSEYSNVYNTALSILRKKGYQLWYSQATGDFCAEKNGWDFMSATPCGLLGLIGIFEFKDPSEFGEYWWREEGPEDYRALPQEPERPFKRVGTNRG
jgi:hypothetical protein